MRKKLLDISAKIDNPRLSVLKKIKTSADSLQIDFFLVGATVRDMILNSVYNIKIYRATNDIDFAVRVKCWDEYTKLTSEIEKLGFKKDSSLFHRYYYKELIIDFIPFGEIADQDNVITWQENDNKIMSVIGFDDAFLNTVELLIQTDPVIVIKAASVESLVMLKIFSWNERAADMRIKDAKDLYLIISNYLDVGNENRLFDEHDDIFEEAQDYELSGARLLGRDLARIASNEVKKNLLNILKDDKLESLALEMTFYEGLSSERDERFEKCLNLLKNICLSLKE